MYAMTSGYKICITGHGCFFEGVYCDIPHFGISELERE